MISRSVHFQNKVFEKLQGYSSTLANSGTTEDGEPLGFIPSSKEVATLESQPFPNQWPTSFKDVVGQKKTLMFFARTLATQSPPRVAIGSGFRGIGKSSMLPIYGVKCACYYFHFKSCFFASCRDCLHDGWSAFQNSTIDCARVEVADIQKMLNKYRYPPCWPHSNKHIIFFDELNHDKTVPISILLTKFVEETRDLVVLIACNEGISKIDYGLLARAVPLEFKVPEIVEITSWLCRYGFSVNIPLSLFHAFIIAKCIQPERIPREALKQLEMLRGVPSGYFDDVLMEIFSIDRRHIKELAELFSEHYEADCKKELENWD